MLNRVKLSGLQPKTIAPATRITTEISVLNVSKDSTEDTRVTLPARDSSVAETVTSCRDKRARRLAPAQSITANQTANPISNSVPEMTPVPGNPQ